MKDIPPEKRWLRYDARDRWRLVMAHSPEKIARLEAELKITQVEAVTDILDYTSWGDNFPEFRNGKGSPRERRDALIDCHEDAFHRPVQKFIYEGDPHPGLNRENQDWDAYDAEIGRIYPAVWGSVNAARGKMTDAVRPSLFVQSVLAAALECCLEATGSSAQGYDMFETLANGTPELHEADVIARVFDREWPPEAESG